VEGSVRLNYGNMGYVEGKFVHPLIDDNDDGGSSASEDEDDDKVLQDHPDVANNVAPPPKTMWDDEPDKNRSKAERHR
jgi:hypothetical protein